MVAVILDVVSLILRRGDQKIVGVIEAFVYQLQDEPYYEIKSDGLFEIACLWPFYHGCLYFLWLTCF